MTNAGTMIWKAGGGIYADQARADIMADPVMR